ncbi:MULTISPECIES: hypothetical protein [Methanothermobacter]|jgi:hypothetical protein|uniref:Uncharacterized protein n=1 Tax=Methanothermobacter thermautotrophicus (strain ATCC 29096 / DSM 1053 / JCM 10044 / NBRC 100330 / Delta H) TaxID=187420 RepID=O26483_METTH|nr:MULTISPECIES: hypothetical protein [Methanothermobacter]AAB84889.1 unknown [Methanothermobacter thermautotrophicus str. Delta H]WBF06674.1 hypothetical protein ISG35_01770 [Methanothermobacter thermautotrophicus]BAZ98426.1 hypothetical protein tca_00351 [Methanothermobacter sp. EMTCatA1]HOQ18578.1 hypothetical protein [Methanothermobacter thermautotrophicus]
MLKTAGMVTAVILLLLLKPAAGATAVQEVTVTVPESVEIMVLWQGRETGNSFTLTATVEPGKEYYWPGGPQGLQIKDLSNVPIDLYIRAEGDLQGPETIPIQNLKYANYGIGLPETPLTTTYTPVRKNWMVKSEDESLIPVDLHLTVPPATAAGVYSVNIYHIAVPHGE